MNLRKLRWLAGAYIKRHRLVSLLGLLLLLVAAIVIRYSSGQTLAASFLGTFSENSYIEGTVGSPKTLNPIFVASDTERSLSGLIFRGLTKASENGDALPDLAESWEESSGGQDFLFHLKPNQKFQNGDAVTADDVVYTYNLAKDPGTGSRLSDTFKGLSIQAVDQETVLFRLPEPFSPFLSLTDLGILDKQATERQTSRGIDLHNLNLSGLGTTDFRLISLSKDTATLSRSGVNYIFHFYQSDSDLQVALKLGEINAAGFSEAVDLSAWPNLKVNSSPLYRRFVGIFYNERSGATGERGVRQALSLSLSRDEIIQKGLDGAGLAAFSPIPPTSWAKADNVRRYDQSIDGSKQALDKVGWVGGPVRSKDGKMLEITLTFIDTPEQHKVADIISAEWAEVGVRAILNPLDNATYRSKVLDAKDFQAALVTQEIGVDPDQYVLWHTTQVNGSNITGVNVPKLDKALEDGRHSEAKSDRIPKYADFQRFFLDEDPVSILYYPVYSFVTSTKIKGVDIKNLGLPADRLNTLDSWQIGRTIL